MGSNVTHPFQQTDLKGQSLFFIAGPCVIESEQLCLSVADTLAQFSSKYSISIVFKSSFDKANRTSRTSFRGPGIDEGLRILQKVKDQSGLPLLTDIHTPDEVDSVAQVVDILQIPAFLCRQTDLLEKAGATNKYVNIKKGQFMAPADMRFALEKAGSKCLLTERGTFFGYNRLVVDFGGLHIMKKLGVPVIFDATHSVQIPGGGDGCSSGNRELIIPLAFAALCQGINGLFFETHPEPSKAQCDKENTISLTEFEKNLPRFIEIFEKMRDWE